MNTAQVWSDQTLNNFATNQIGYRTSHSEVKQRGIYIDPLDQSQINRMKEVLGDGVNAATVVLEGVQQVLLSDPPGELLHKAQQRFPAEQVTRLSPEARAVVKQVEDRQIILRDVNRTVIHLYDRVTNATDVARCNHVYMWMKMCKDNVQAQTAFCEALKDDQAYNKLKKINSDWETNESFHESNKTIPTGPIKDLIEGAAASGAMLPFRRRDFEGPS